MEERIPKLDGIPPGNGIHLSHSSELNSSKRPKVFIIYTGGTMGMKKDEVSGVLVPTADFLAEQLASFPEMKAPEMPTYEIFEFNPLLDSSDMSYEEWHKVAKLIEKHYYDYDGFVVIHGTDTMAFTACALSFMLENLGKTVVLTGSQVSIAELMNDARKNLITSIIAAGSIDVPEVCIFFNNSLLRGCRSKKVDSWGLDAFASPNCPPLGTLGIEFNISQELILSQPKGRLRVSTKMNQNIAVLHLVPEIAGFSDEVVENLLKPPLEGLIIQSYGSGNAPAKKKIFLSHIKNAVSRGVIVVVTTQCLRGSVNLQQYATGQSLLEAGAISGLDMTVECAAIKLAYLMGMGLPKDQVRELMSENLRGELTKKKKQFKV